MIYTCSVCHRSLQTKASDDRSESAWSVFASGLRPVVSYAYKLEDSYCCQTCIEEADGLGKFESYMTERGRSSTVRKAYGSERKPLATALILYAWSLDSSEDDYMTSEGWGYCGRFGNFLLFEDDRGFVTFEEHKDEASAEKEFQRLYNEGWGASEDDAYIYSERSLRNGWHGWQAQMEGKTLNVYPPRHSDYISENRARAAVRLEAMRSGFWPNLWRQEERGGLTLLSY